MSKDCVINLQAPENLHELISVRLCRLIFRVYYLISCLKDRIIGPNSP
jgi:hypothetical protein